MRLRRRAKGGTTPGCSFCGKGRHQVERLVAGPGVFICDKCVRLCVEIIEEHDPRPCR